MGSRGPRSRQVHVGVLMGPVCGLSRVVAGLLRATRRGAAVFGVALALGLTAASPAAASLWTAAANVSEEGQSAYRPQVAVDAAGDAIAVWARSNGSNDVVQAALKPAGELWGKPATLSEAGEEASAPEVAVDSAGEAIAVWTRSNGSNDVVQAALKPAGEPWGTPVALSEAGQDAHAPEVAVDSAGEAIAVWTGSNGSNDVVQAAVKSAGEPWAKSAPISEAGQEASEPEVAVDAAGDATVVWTRYIGLSSGGMSNYVVQATVKPVGEVWEAPTTVSEESKEEGLEPRVAVDAAGDATAIWKRFAYGGRAIQTAVKPVGKPWGTPTSFGQGGDPRIVVNAAGDAAAIWSEYGIVQATVKPVGEPWVKPAPLSDPDAESAPQVAVDAAGAATAVWTHYNGGGFGNYIVQAAQYSPSTAFTIETLQKLSPEPTYTKAELNGEVADTVDYEIIVKNTGSTSLKFGALADSACESTSPAGSTELLASTEETFTCTHKLTAFVKYSNQASIEGNEGTGTKTSNSVTVALAPVYEAPAGTADSSSGSCVESRVAVFACSDLRAAVVYADADPGSTVKLEPGAYQLGEAHGYPSGARAFLEITASMTIQGAGSEKTTIEQTDGRDPIIVAPYDAGFSRIEIDGVKLTGGVAAGNDDGESFGWEKGGGALRILGSGTASASVTLTDDDLTGNLAHAKSAKGGAIFNRRTLNIIDSSIAHNTALAEGAATMGELGEANGGAIFNLGHLLIAGSTIADNTVEAGGAYSEAVGGGVDSGVENFSNEATAAIANTTITGNIASAGTTVNPPFVYGGGVAMGNGSNLDHVTLYGNTASPVNASQSWGGNIYVPDGGGAGVNDSIVADGSASEGPNCLLNGFRPNPEDNRDDLEDGPSGGCGFSPEYGGLLDVSAQLMPLADNGGPTETLAPAPGSPVIDAGGGCEGIFGDSGSGWTTAMVPLDVDQRGMPRNGHCDIGAFQTEPPFAAVPPQISGTAEVGKTLTCTPGAWTGEGTLNYSYDWLRNGVLIGDETTSYTIVPSDAEAQIACLVTVSGAYGPTEATSPSIEVQSITTSSNPPTGETGEHLATRSSLEEEKAAVKKHEEEAAARTGVLGVEGALPDATLTKASLTAGSEGTLNVEVSCPAGTISCTGTITLKTLNAVSAATAHRAKKRKATIVTLAVGSFKVTGGHMTTVKLRLWPKARALLARKALRVRATIVARDPAGATHTTQTILKIRAANAKHGKGAE
jgi:hypothetical protein